MPFKKKMLPPPAFRLVFNPGSDTEYIHFEHARDLPFDATSRGVSRLHARWLAEAALLTYWDAKFAQQKLFDLAGLHSEPLGNRGTQGFIAWNDQFALVAFRGTEPDSVLDIVTDARIPLIAWDVPHERVHAGFEDALEEVWPQLLASPLLKTRA